jgi:hypothetical protein
MPDDIFYTRPIPTATQAQLAADELMRKVSNELNRRASEHIDGFSAFFHHPHAKPQQIADAMNGDAVKWLALSRLNLQHIADYAAIVGKSLDDFVPTKYQSSGYSITELPSGYITLTKSEQ